MLLIYFLIVIKIIEDVLFYFLKRLFFFFFFARANGTRGKTRESTLKFANLENFVRVFIFRTVQKVFVA